jgi:hypothetical protein
MHRTSGKSCSRKSAWPRSNTYEHPWLRSAASGYYPDFLMTVRRWLDGEWTGKMLFYGIVFGITLFMSFYFVPVAFFGS